MPATSVTLSFPADLSRWDRDQLTTNHMRAYLKKTQGPAREGDVWEVFLDVGCCGDSPDVPLRVEAVESASGDDDVELDENTRIEYVERDACGVNTGWKVQSEDGPPAST